MKKNNKQYEILILAVLVIILAGYAVTVYLIGPIRAETERVNQLVTQKEAEIKTTYFTVSSYESKSRRLTELSAGLRSAAEAFYAAEKEDAYLDLVNLNVKDCKVTFSSLNASEAPLRAVSLYADSDAGARMLNELTADPKMSGSRLIKNGGFADWYEKVSGNAGRLEKEVTVTTMTVEATGKYSAVMKFLGGLTEGGKTVICNSMTLDIAENVELSAPSDPEARLVVTLLFLRVPGAGEMSGIPAPEPLPAYVFPQDIIDGSYRRSGGLF